MLSLVSLIVGAAALGAKDCVATGSRSDCPGSGELTVVERRATAVLCSAGFEFDPDENCCVMEEVTDARLFCEAGDLVGDFCAVRSRPQPTCPENFTLGAAGCVRRSKGTMSAGCAAGYLDGAHCVDRVPVDLEFVCPEGSAERGGACFVTKTFRHTFHCPAGWDRNADRCVLEEIVDCTDANLPGECGEFCYLDTECEGRDCFASKAEIEARIAKRKRRGLSAAVSPHSLCSSRPCEVRKMAPRPREESLELVSQTCLRRTETDADVFCEGGAVFDGRGCCVQVPVDKVPVCPAEGTVHDCYSVVRKPASADCPPGFDKRCRGASAFSCQCVREDVVPPEPVCLVGGLEEGSCVDYLPASPYCPEQDAQLVGGVCVRVAREPIRLRTEIVVECEGEECHEKLDDFDDFQVVPEIAGDATAVDASEVHDEVHWGGSFAESDTPAAGSAVVEVTLSRQSRREQHQSRKAERKARKAERKAIRKARRCEKKNCRRQRRRRCDDCDGQLEMIDEL